MIRGREAAYGFPKTKGKTNYVSEILLIKTTSCFMSTEEKKQLRKNHDKLYCLFLKL